MPTIAIVGAGIIGVTTALALVQRGFNIVLIDKAQKVASATSRNNGAQLSYAYADAMASPGLFAMAGRIALGQEPGLQFRLTPSIHNLSWLAAFLMQSSQRNFIANTRTSLQTAVRSKKQMDRWREHFNFEHEMNGKLLILPNQSSVDQNEVIVDLKNEFGFDQSILTKEEAIAVEPALKRFAGKMAGAVYSPHDEVGDPHQFANGVLNYLLSVSDNNVFLSNHDVTGLVIKNGTVTSLQSDKGLIEADGYVFASGHLTTKFAKQLGVKIPVVPVSGYSLTYPLGENAPKHSITDVKGKAVLCPLGDKLRIAGLADIGDASTTVRSGRLEQLKSVLFDRFPGAANSNGVGEPWIGHRPVTPNSQPIVGQTKLSNTFLNCGHGSLGWTMAAGSAEQLATQICVQFGKDPKDVQEITTGIGEQGRTGNVGSDLAMPA